MEIEIVKEIPFDTEDMMALRAFLETRAGSRLIPRLLSEAPSNLAGGDVNAILIRSGEVRGWQQMASSLFAIAYPAPEIHKNEKGNSAGYPPLDNDSAWNDGQKLEQTEKPSTP